MKDFSDADYEQMDRYLNYSLPEDEQRTFEKRLLNDPDLAAEVEWLRSLYANYRFIHKKKAVKKLHDELAAEGLLATQPLVRPLWGNSLTWSLLAAASVVVFLGIGFWFLRPQSITPGDNPSVAVDTPAKPPQSQTATTPKPTVPPVEVNASTDLMALAQAYANEPPTELGAVPAGLQEGISAYQNNELDVAIAQLQKPLLATPKATDGPPSGEKTYGSSRDPKPVLEPATTRQYRQLYLGLSYLKANQIQQALTTLKQVDQVALRPTAQWYQALCYVQLNQPESAIRLLKAIVSQPDHPYYADAQPLLESLTTE